MPALLLVRYGEIALKGKNRPFFEKRLLSNIQNALQGLEPYQVSLRWGRYYVEVEEERVLAASRRLERVFGIVSTSPVIAVPLALEQICSEALRLIEASCRQGLAFKANTNCPGDEKGGSFRAGFGLTIIDDIPPQEVSPHTFKVNTRRANKSFPYTSPEINSMVGEHILKSHLQLKVDVHHPDLIINIEIREKEAYLYTRVFPGPGGLPVGVTGKGLLLLSGGIDSPVAGWMALKRGVEIEALHFHSPPFTGEGAVNKVIDLCSVLAGWGEPVTLHLAPFTQIQKQLRLECPQKLLITLMRRAMYRIAASLAEKRGIPVLFTGESLGQVASQTLENLVATNEVTTMPVFRPLIGLDKEEITARAKKIESYSVSIRTFKDCCTLFVPQHPVTRPTLHELKKAEAGLPLEELIADCLDKIESRVLAAGHKPNLDKPS